MYIHLSRLVAGLYIKACTLEPIFKYRMPVFLLLMTVIIDKFPAIIRTNFSAKVVWKGKGLFLKVKEKLIKSNYR